MPRQMVMALSTLYTARRTLRNTEVRFREIKRGICLHTTIRARWPSGRAYEAFYRRVKPAGVSRRLRFRSVSES